MPEDYLYGQMYSTLTGKHIGAMRTLGKRYVTGDIIQRYVPEGHIPWHVDRVEDAVYDSGTKYQKVFVTIGEFEQTHCDHQWLARPKITIAGGYERACQKCGLQEEFNYGKGAWEERA